MNKNRMLMLGFFALVLSVAVTYLAYRMLQSRLAPPEEVTQLVVAAEKLPLGTRITEKHLRVTSWPKATPIEGGYADPAQLIGRGVIIPLAPNEPILESKLAAKEAGAGLTSAIPEGMRAVSIKVNDVIGVAGFVTPGTKVDVIVIGEPDVRGTASKIFLENVQVLAAGQNVEQDSAGKPQNVPVVTLLLTPEDSQKMALANNQGRIQLVLRNPLDLEQADPPAARVAQLYGGSSAAPAPAAPEQPRPVVVRYRRPAPPAPKVVSAPAPAPVVEPPPRLFQVELITGSKRETSTFKANEPE